MAADIEKIAAATRTEGDEAHAERVTEVFRHHRESLFAWLRRKAPKNDAEEIVDRAFTNVLEMGKSLCSVSNLVAYVRKSATHQLINYYRDRSARRKKLVLLIPEGSETGDSLESIVLKEELQGALMRVVRELPPRCRMAFQLRVWEGMSCKEIAARLAEQGLSVTERTVLRDISFAYEACQRALEAWEKSTARDGNDRRA